MFLPLLFNVKYHKVTIIGGGKIALRKAIKVLDYGGEVTCISPNFEKGFSTLDKVQCIQKYYDKELLKEGLVIAATNDYKLNLTVYNDCQQLGLFCSRVDEGEGSDFIFSASEQTQDIIISVSTKGKNPARAKKVLAKLIAKYEVISEELDKEKKNNEN